jgi:hypothetical protein
MPRRNSSTEIASANRGQAARQILATGSTPWRDRLVKEIAET